MASGKRVDRPSKINRSEFLRTIAKKHCEVEGKFSSDDIRSYEQLLTKAFSEITEEIVCCVSHGHDVAFTGFGVFSLREHKGHPVRFGAATPAIGSYRVLKFSASGMINRRLRDGVKENSGGVCDEEIGCTEKE